MENQMTKFEETEIFAELKKNDFFTLVSMILALIYVMNVKSSEKALEKKNEASEERL